MLYASLLYPCHTDHRITLLHQRRASQRTTKPDKTWARQHLTSLSLCGTIWRRTTQDITCAGQYSTTQYITNALCHVASLNQNSTKLRTTLLNQGRDIPCVALLHFTRATRCMTKLHLRYTQQHTTSPTLYATLPSSPHHHITGLMIEDLSSVGQMVFLQLLEEFFEIVSVDI